MKSFDDKESVQFSEQSHSDESYNDGWSAVVGNERMTALAGAVLLVLILVELVSAAVLHALLSVHVFVGVLLTGPLVVKLTSTSSRFLRYYTGSPAFVHKGPPHLALRALAPPLIIATLLVLSSGIGLVALGPHRAGPLVPLHAISALALLPLLAIHIFAHIRRVPRLVTDDWSSPSTEQAPGRVRRLGANIGALLLGAVAAILLFPGATPWIAWSQAKVAIPGPLIVGLLAAALALLAIRPLRWR